MKKSLLAVVVAMGLAVSMTNAHADTLAGAETELAAIQAGMSPTEVTQKINAFLNRLPEDQKDNLTIANQEMRKFNLPDLVSITHGMYRNRNNSFDYHANWGGSSQETFPSYIIISPPANVTPAVDSTYASYMASTGGATVQQPSTTTTSGVDVEHIKDRIAHQSDEIEQNKAAIVNLQNKPIPETTTSVRRDYRSVDHQGEYVFGDGVKNSLDETLANIGQRTVVNEQSISELSTKHDEVVATVENHEQRITANRTDIDSLGNAVNQHATEINKLQDASRASLEVVKEHAAAIDNNTNHIANHERRIQNNEQELANHEQRIQANEQWQGEAEASVNELIDAHNEVVDEVNAQGQQVSRNSETIQSNSNRISNVESKTNANAKAIAKNRKIAAGGVAGAMAMANIPQVSALGHYSVGAGVGGYDGANSVAVGFSARINHTTVIKVTASSDTTGNVGYGAGLATEW